MRFRNLLTPADINLWDQLFCWLLKIYFCNSFINHKLIEQLIKKFDSLTPKFYYSSFIHRIHFLKFKVTIIITINSHYWLQVYQLTFYHVVMWTASCRVLILVPSVWPFACFDASRLSDNRGWCSSSLTPRIPAFRYRFNLIFQAPFIDTKAHQLFAPIRPGLTVERVIEQGQNNNRKWDKCTSRFRRICSPDGHIIVWSMRKYAFKFRNSLRGYPGRSGNTW